MLGEKKALRDNSIYVKQLSVVSIQRAMKTLTSSGFNVETVTFQGSKFTIWDLSGKNKKVIYIKMSTIVPFIAELFFSLSFFSFSFCLDILCIWKCPLSDQVQENYEGTRAIIFVIDSKDRDRLGACKEELRAILAHEKLEDVVVLVMANKQDLGTAAVPENEMTQILEVDKIVGRMIGEVVLEFRLNCHYIQNYSIVVIGSCTIDY